jgi:hypothetical protein
MALLVSFGAAGELRLPAKSGDEKTTIEHMIAIFIFIYYSFHLVKNYILL